MFTPSALGGHALYTQALLRSIAQLAPSRNLTPALVTSMDLAPEFDIEAYPVHKVLPRMQFREEFGSRLSWAWSRLTHYQRRNRALLQWIRTQPRLQLLHFQEHAPLHGSGIYRAIRRENVRIVETVHNIEPHRFANRLHLFLLCRANRAAWRASDALIVHTEKLRADLSAFLGAGHPPIHVTPHGIWDVDQAPEKQKPGSPPRLLFFGILRENKGLSILLDAMESLPGYSLTIAGRPESADQAQEIRRKLQAFPSGQVEFIDRFVSDEETVQLFDSADLVVLPYTAFNAQSGVLHMAMAHGRPVVASEVGALGETLRAWGSGLVVPPGESQALAQAIRTATDPGRFRELAAAAVRVRRSYSWSQTADLTIAVYRSCLERSRPRTLVTP